MSLLVIADASSDASDVAMPTCGVSATYVILRSYSLGPGLAEIKAKFREGGNDVELEKLRLADLRRVLEGYGFEVDTRRYELAQAGSIPVPSILYLSRGDIHGAEDVGHYVVLTACDGDTVHLIDPEMSAAPIKAKLSRLARSWDGTTLTPTPIDSSLAGRISRTFWPLVAVECVVGLGLFISAAMTRKRQFSDHDG